MANLAVKASKRDTSKNPRKVRAEGNLPATIYGKGQESVSIELNRREFINLYKNNKEAVFDISVDNKKYSATVQKLQVEAGTQKEMNVEFKLA